VRRSPEDAKSLTIVPPELVASFTDVVIERGLYWTQGVAGSFRVAETRGFRIGFPPRY